jgi:transcriptional regulator with XRE-family HTH domain
MSDRFAYVLSVNFRIVYILAAYRRLLSLTKEEVASTLKISAPYLSQLESGNRVISDNLVRSYSDYIGDNLNYDSDAFYSALKDVAPKLKLTGSQAGNNLSFLNCLKKITVAMLKSKKIEKD